MDNKQIDEIEVPEDLIVDDFAIVSREAEKAKVKGSD